MKRSISTSSNIKFQQLDQTFTGTTGMELVAIHSPGSGSSSDDSVSNLEDLRLNNGSNSNDEDHLRVLIYATCYNVMDGVTITIRKLEREILDAGGYVCIVTTLSGKPSNTHLVGEHPNRRVIFMDNSLPIPFQTDPNDPTISYQAGISLSSITQREMDDFQPNIIHITSPDFTSLHVHNYARERHIPLMGTYHSNIADYMTFVPGLSWLKPCLEMLFRHIYNFLVHLYVPTPFIKNMLEEQGMHHCTEVKVWGRGVDLNKFNPNNCSRSFREKLNIPEETPLVLYVGRLVAEKSVDIVADVIRRLNNESDVDFRAIIVGAGPVEYLIEGLPNTHHLGWLDGEGLTEAYASCDIFLFPSSVETFGNVTLEAAASGLPLVVESNCSGHLVTEGVNGFPCQKGDASAFFNGTLALCKNAEMRKSYSRESIKLSKTMEQSQVVRQMLDNYAEVRRVFYEEYGGSHLMRDEAYRTPKSFRMGLDPRPFGWGLIEFFCFSLLRFANFMIKLMDKLKERRNRRYDGLNSEEDEDLEEALSSEPQVVLNSGNDTTRVATDVIAGPGCLCSVLISIGDSRAMVICMMFLLNIPLFFVRVISAMKRDCGKRCGRSRLDLKNSAAFRMERSKRIY